MKTVSVGIPAYNEEANIGRLLAAVLNQRQEGWELGEVIVISDGSSDGTVEAVKRFEGDGVKLIDRASRMGVGVGSKQIMELAESEVLVMLNADIAINSELVAKLARPIWQEGYDLTAARGEWQVPKKTIEKILAAGEKFKADLFENINGGNSVYTCRGLARGFSKRLYKRLNLIKGPADDALSYMECVGKGWKFKAVGEAQVRYKLPDNWRDYLRQSQRFVMERKAAEELVLERRLGNIYGIDKELVVEAWWNNWRQNPVWLTIYVVTLAVARVWPKKWGQAGRWETAQSTKSLAWQDE